MFESIQKRPSRLVVIQAKSHVDHYKENLFSENDFILPIGPEAMFYVELNSWKYYSLKDLWIPEQCERELNLSQVKIDDLIKELNCHSQACYPDFGLEIGNYYGFQLSIIISQVRFNHFIMRSMLENLKPKEVLCYTKKNSKVFMKYRPDPGSLLADVLIKVGGSKDGRLKIHEIFEKSSRSVRETLLSFLPGSMRNFLRKARDGMLVNNPLATHNLLAIGAYGSWGRVIRDRDFNKIFKMHTFERPADLLGQKLNPLILKILNKAIQVDEIIPYDLSSLAEHITSDLLCMAAEVQKTDTSLRKYDALVTNGMVDPWDLFIAHRATLKGVPVVVWQHGEKGQVGWHWLSLYTEIVYATDYLAYGKAVEDLYSMWIGRYQLKSVRAVGASTKVVDWQGGETIVYATGKWFKTTDFGDPDRRLFNAHRKILGYLDRLGQNYPVIFKANNTPGMNHIPYSFKNIIVDTTHNFTDHLRCSKLIILDTPATTLVEACLTRVPIFVLGGRTNYTDEFLEVIRKRVVWCDTPEEIVLRVSQYLQFGIYDANVEDKTYVDMFIGPAENSKIINNVQTALMEIIIDSY